jgi:hypothetical protein
MVRLKAIRSQIDGLPEDTLANIGTFVKEGEVEITRGKPVESYLILFSEFLLVTEKSKKGRYKARELFPLTEIMLLEKPQEDRTRISLWF